MLGTTERFRLARQCCRLTFLITNEPPAPLAKAVYKTLLSVCEGTVNQLTLFDFEELLVGLQCPAG